VHYQDESAVIEIPLPIRFVANHTFGGTRRTREFESVLNRVAPHAKVQIATLPDARRSPPKHPVGRISSAHPARGRLRGAPSLSARIGEPCCGMIGNKPDRQRFMYDTPLFSLNILLIYTLIARVT
jgi:hypothetical protein